MKPTPERTKHALKKLRAIVETSKCPIEIRIAYAVEHGIRWATENTVGWPAPSKSVLDDARILKADLK